MNQNFSAQHFGKEGCLIVDRLFETSIIDAIYEEYKRQFPILDSSELPAHLKVGNLRFQLPIRLTGPLLEPVFFANPIITWLLRQLLGEDFLIDNFTCVVALAGAAEQKLHRDHPSLYPMTDEARKLLQPFAITLAIPLIDLNATTGTTKLFDGSHLAPPDYPSSDPGIGLLPYVSRGGCYFMDYRLLHRGMPNLSEAARPIIYINYARSWFTDMINFKKHERLNICYDDAQSIDAEYRPLFRRLAGKGGFDMSIKEWLGDSAPFATASS